MDGGAPELSAQVIGEISLAIAPQRGLARSTLETANEDADLFDPVSLPELGAATLMERIDRKWLAPADALSGLMRRMRHDYRVLEVADRRVRGYSTLYYDTPDLALYHAHHAGRARRHKVRVRRYAGGAEQYLEVKTKTANGRTTKQRVLLNEPTADPLARLEEAAPNEVIALRSQLSPAICVDYTRITLVRPDASERVTLDIMLRFLRGGRVCAFPGAVIAEAKQHGRSRSPFIDAMRALNLREIALSKYCAGIANLEPAAKSNHFRPALRRLAAAGR